MRRQHPARFRVESGLPDICISWAAPRLKQGEGNLPACEIPAMARFARRWRLEEYFGVGNKRPPVRNRSASCGQIRWGGKRTRAIGSGSPHRQDLRRIRPRFMFLRRENLARSTSHPPIMRTPARIFAFCGVKSVIGSSAAAILNMRVSEDTLKRNRKEKRLHVRNLM